MATVANLESFRKHVADVSSDKAPHIWIDHQSTLVLGVYPKPTYVFDFGAERFLLNEEAAALSQVNDVTSIAPLTLKAEMFEPTAAPKARVSLLHKAPRVTGKFEIETKDSIFVLGSATEVLKFGLAELERLVPGTLGKLSQQKKRSKRPVAIKREDLYDMPSQAKHAVQLENGYWVATNNKAHEAINVVREAAKIANLGPNNFGVREVS